MKKTGKAFTLTMAVGMAAMAMPASAAGIEAYVNNNAVTFDTPPVIVENSTLVPARAIFEALGGEMSWDEATKTVGITTKDGKAINLVIDSADAKVDTKDVKMSVPAKIMNGRTMVPLRFVSENCGYKVDWNGETQRIDIVTPDASKETPVAPEKPAATESKDGIFTSTSGIKVPADKTWTMGTKDSAYVDAQSPSDLVLVKGEQAFLTIEKNDVTKAVATFKDVYDTTKELAKTADKEKAVAALKEAKYTTADIALFEAAWAKDNASINDLYLQVTNNDFFVGLKTAYPDFVLVGQEDVQVLGQNAKLAEYKYTEKSGVVLHNYEVSVIDGTQMYTISAWTIEKDFAANQAELKNMIIKASK